MLRFWVSKKNGNYLNNNQEEEKYVKKLICEKFKFKPDHIERVQIREGKEWCIVTVRAPLKFIKDRMKRQKLKRERDWRNAVQFARRERLKLQKQKAKKQNNAHDQDQQQDEQDQDEQDEEEEEEAPKVPQQPICYIDEYRRRNIADDSLENEKLHILNFDILNENCHKALTKLFLKFGDLAGDIQINRARNNDPFAQVRYKNLEDARMVWRYQNGEGDADRPLKFGGRVLTIQYAKKY